MQATAVSAVKPPPRVTQPMDFHFASEDRIRDRNNMKRKSVPNAAETHVSSHVVFKKPYESSRC